MSEKTDKPMGLPPYYWAKPPPQPKQSTGFVNKQQRKFYLIVTGFKLAKIIAAAALALLIIARI